MKLTVDMPVVTECAARECGYNTGGHCHAHAITVGDGIHPACDTFLRSREHHAGRDPAGVGACKVEACQHNRNLECHAGAIRVGHHGNHADCLTFEKR